MRILVTGGTGFIGTHVVDLLSRSSHEVVCLVRPTSDTHAAQRAGARLVFGDVTERDSVHRAVEGCDAVINLANIYEFWLRRMRDFRRVNVEGTRNVMEVALDASVQKVVHVSTLATFGYAPNGLLTEQSAPGARHPSRYSRTKYEGEQICWELHRTRGLPLVVVYPGVATGAGDTKPSGCYIEALLRHRIPAQVLRAARMAWVHVDDVARIITAALEHPDNIGERYFAAAETLSFEEINRLVREISGCRLPRLAMPTPLLLTTAAFLTFFGRVAHVAPMLGMSLDQIRTMKLGFSADGSKATRELGVYYEPVRTALAECIEFQGGAQAKRQRAHA